MLKTIKKIHKKEEKNGICGCLKQEAIRLQNNKSMISPELVYNNIPKKQSDYFLSIIQKIGKEKQVKKGEILIKNGSHSSFFFYIVSGVFKTYLEKNDKPYILGFTFESDIDGCPRSLLKGIANNFHIEAVTDSTVLICEFNDFQKACTPEKFTSITNNIITNYISLLETRTIEALALNAEQRYEKLRLQHPILIEKIPLTAIASFLGITTERLSRIRRKHKDLT